MSSPWMESWNLPIALPIAEAAVAMLLAGAVALSRRFSARESYKRGAKILDGGAARRHAALLQLIRSEPLLTLAGVGIAPDEEVKHFKLIGRSSRILTGDTCGVSMIRVAVT
jgi:hypothetical protein